MIYYSLFKNVVGKVLNIVTDELLLERKMKIIDFCLALTIGYIWYVLYTFESIFNIVLIAILAAAGLFPVSRIFSSIIVPRCCHKSNRLQKNA